MSIPFFLTHSIFSTFQLIHHNLLIPVVQRTDVSNAFSAGLRRAEGGDQERVVQADKGGERTDGADYEVSTA